MSSFIIKSRADLDDLNWIVRNPITKSIDVPILLFNPAFTNPFYSEVDLLNDDRMYQARVIDHFYTRLTEKWLYKKPIYRKLLKYFQVKKSGDEGKVQLISDPDNVSKSNISSEDSKYVFKYIEKYFVSRRFVEKVLREYVATTRIKWYDLFNNSDTLVDLLAHKLKKLIISTIYEAQK
uniref:Uncharacterized protein n=1 Tax=viral metagenome TaxID=1070528 RepID=A0A6C0CCP6_9ZZZZ